MIQNVVDELPDEPTLKNWDKCKRKVRAISKAMALSPQFYENGLPADVIEDTVQRLTKIAGLDVATAKELPGCDTRPADMYLGLLVSLGSEVKVLSGTREKLEARLGKLARAPILLFGHMTILRNYETGHPFPASAGPQDRSCHGHCYRIMWQREQSFNLCMKA